MNRERATIVALIIALFSLMIIFISIEREVSDVKALSARHPYGLWGWKGVS